MRSQLIQALAIVACAVVMFGCSQQSTEVVQEDKAVEQADVSVASPNERAAKAKDELARRLSTELIAAMSDGGPESAIKVCSEVAPVISKTVGEELGVTIGRTSQRLRNAANKPPDWAKAHIGQGLAETRFEELPDGATGALFPIRLKSQCLVCHGPKEQIAPGVLDRLAKLYPSDAATGFKEDDLRGWFWVEVRDAADNSEKTTVPPDASANS